MYIESALKQKLDVSGFSTVPTLVPLLNKIAVFPQSHPVLGHTVL